MQHQRRRYPKERNAMTDLTPAELMDDDRSHCEGWIRQDEMAREAQDVLAVMMDRRWT